MVEGCPSTIFENSVKYTAHLTPEENRFPHCLNPLYWLKGEVGIEGSRGGRRVGTSVPFYIVRFPPNDKRPTFKGTQDTRKVKGVIQACYLLTAFVVTTCGKLLITYNTSNLRYILSR